MPARNIGDVHQPGVVNILFELLNEIALGDLLVEEIVQQLNLRMIHGTNYFEALGDGREVILGILFGIDVFEQQTDGLAVDLLSLDKTGGALETFDAALVLSFAR